MNDSGQMLVGFLFWTMVTSVLPMIWYFPLWALSFTGAEIAPVLPAVVMIFFGKPLTKVAGEHCSIIWAIAVGLQIVATMCTIPAARVFCACLALTFLLHFFLLLRRDVLVGGFFLQSALRFAFFGSNPLWPHQGNSPYILALLGLFSIPFVYRSSKDTVTLQSTSKWRFFGATISIGACLYALSTFVAEWTSISILHGKGEPAVHGALVGLLSMISIFFAKWTEYRVLSALVAAIGYHFVLTKPSFFGSLSLALYSILQLPTMLSAMESTGPLGLGMGFIVYLIFVLLDLIPSRLLLFPLVIS